MECARLTRYGLLSVSGDDAREFLHAQLTKDIRHLPADSAALAGWCSAKGRLLASFVVIPRQGGFVLQLARDLAAQVAKRLGMYVLRAKVKIADESDAWAQFGVWGAPAPAYGVVWDGDLGTVRIADDRMLRLGPLAQMSAIKASASEEEWIVQEIRAGRPFISAATQDQFVPQMVNLETLGGVDFQKGCYPGQEIVARAQYRGQVKRRMVHLQAPAGRELRPGEDYDGAVVVDSAGGELLAVKPI